MNDIAIFEHHEFGRVRTLIENEEVLFAGIDVASALGYDQPRKAIERHCRYGMKRTVPHPQSQVAPMNKARGFTKRDVKPLPLGTGI